MFGTMGTSVEDRVRMIENRNKQLVKGRRVYEVAYVRYDPLYDKETEMASLPTHSKAEADRTFAARNNNPHCKNVRMLSRIY